MMTFGIGKLTCSRAVLFCCLLILSACGHTPEKRSPALIQAIEFNQQGEKAFINGDYQRAIDNFMESLRLNQSVENVDGIAVNRLNLARVYQMQGKLPESHRNADSLLSEQVLHFSTFHLAAAATRKSLLLLQQHDLVAADQWIAKAMVLCDGKCILLGSIANVRTAIALERGDAAAAVLLSEQALKENKPESLLERANALRLAGNARLMMGEYALSVTLLEQALDMDKQLGIAEKIVQDLNALSMVHAALGDAHKADEYTERARRVMSAHQ